MNATIPSRLTSTKRLSAATLTTLLSSAAMLLSAKPTEAAQLVKVQDVGSLPTACGMYVYAPDTLPASPGIMVALHSCQNTANGYFGQMNFAALADKYGFIIIYPESPTSNTDRCWDVNSTASLTHDGGDDSQSVVAMVKYALKKYNADPTKVFSVGGSSGAMMTNVLLATYPDVFAAGSAFAGVPYYCFVGSTYWNNECSGGTTTKTGKEWGDLVRKAYPSFSGTRPRMQLWHGGNDDILNYHNFGEEIKQWTNVLGVSETPTTTEKDKPQSGWTRTLYTDSCGTVQVEANSAANQTHSLQVKGWAESEVIRFFGLDSSNPTKSCAGGTGGAGGTASGGTSSNGGASAQTGGIANRGGATSAASNGGSSTASRSSSSRATDPDSTGAGGTPISSGTGSAAGGQPNVDEQPGKTTTRATTGGTRTSSVGSSAKANGTITSGGTSAASVRDDSAESRGGASTTASGVSTTDAMGPAPSDASDGGCAVARGRAGNAGVTAILLGLVALCGRSRSGRSRWLPRRGNASSPLR